MEYPVLDTKATGARIRELRKARHLKVEDVARFMGFESEQAAGRQSSDSRQPVCTEQAVWNIRGQHIERKQRER